MGGQHAAGGAGLGGTWLVMLTRHGESHVKTQNNISNLQLIHCDHVTDVSGVHIADFSCGGSASCQPNNRVTLPHALSLTPRDTVTTLVYCTFTKQQIDNCVELDILVKPREAARMNYLQRAKSFSPASGTVALGRHRGIFSPFNFLNTREYSLCLTVTLALQFLKCVRERKTLTSVTDTNSSYLRSLLSLSRTRSPTPPRSDTTVVTLLSQVTSAETNSPSTLVDSVLPYGSSQANVSSVRLRRASSSAAMTRMHSLCIFLAVTMLCHQASPTALSNIMVGHAP